MAEAPSTFYRGLRAREALAARAGDITVDDVRGVMLDDFETPWSICYPPRSCSPSDSKSILLTVATLIMRPILGEMCVAMLPALDKPLQPLTPSRCRAQHGPRRNLK